MALFVDRQRLIERERIKNDCAFSAILCMTIVFSVGFIASSVYLYLENAAMEYQHKELQDQIEELRRQLNFSQGTQFDTSDDTLVEREVNELLKQLSTNLSFLMVNLDDYDVANEAPSHTGEVDNNKQIRETENRAIDERAVNFFDLILTQQRQVFEKYCHNPNDTCPVYPGPEGEKGSTGDKGPTGSTGVQGQKGTTGLRGDPGVQGLRGAQGDTGPPGLIGSNGTQGTAGDKGPDGSVGANGLGGSDGIKGMQGDQGIRGEIGSNGTSGIPGDPLQAINGTKGDPGDNGTKGATGDQGLPGPTGQSVNNLGNGCECFKKPSFLDKVTNVVRVAPGGNANFSCIADGNPTPMVTLTKVAPGSGKRSTYQPNGQTGFYAITNAGSSDFGDYMCTATNVYGSASKFFSVTQ
ncbi:collagen alpha-2(VI) chain-like [Dreissena polymorpha]|uniref:collagen alpha-2(VI) chain-like n=1 Tax=Dreissena polymorpha TaxID=45954 RepID=UPI002264B3D4|nr:collagen alpha-2(VI) chain-like [Dreissena polymorpha]